jgi:HK97 family phage major capsid protein
MPLTAEEKALVAEGFKAAGERISGIETETKTGFQEMTATIAEMRNQLKRYSQALLNKSMAEGSYGGFWPTEEMAKEFGGIVLRVLGKKTKDAGSDMLTGGGILVPTGLSTWVIQKLGQYGKFRANALTFPVDTDSLDVPKIEADLTVYAPGQGKEIDKSDVKFSSVGMNVVKFVALTAISRELEEDCVIAIGEIVGTSIARSMAKKEDEIGFLGDGTSDYFGQLGIVGAFMKEILKGGSVASVKGLKVASGNAYNEIALADFEGVISLLPDEADDNARWYVNRKFYFNVMHALALNAGIADYLAILTNIKQRFFFGYPVEFVSSMPSTAANSQICALLGDLKLGAYLAERRILEIEQSNERYFEKDQIGIRGRERVAISGFGVGDTDEAGAIVALIMAAA